MPLQSLDETHDELLAQPDTSSICFAGIARFEVPKSCCEFSDTVIMDAICNVAAISPQPTLYEYHGSNHFSSSITSGLFWRAQLWGGYLPRDQ